HHVKIAIAVARIERFHGHSDEEVALSGMADALATSSVADAIRLMERVRDVIGESALLENPLGIGGQRESAKDEWQQGNQFRFVHGGPSNLSETERSAAPTATADTMATGP